MVQKLIYTKGFALAADRWHIVEWKPSKGWVFYWGYWIEPINAYNYMIGGLTKELSERKRKTKCQTFRKCLMPTVSR